MTVDCTSNDNFTDHNNMESIKLLILVILILILTNMNHIDSAVDLHRIDGNIYLLIMTIKTIMRILILVMLIMILILTILIH